MGKTKTKIIDDSQLEELEKKPAKNKVLIEDKKESAPPEQKSEPVNTKSEDANLTPAVKKNQPQTKKVRSKKYQEATKGLDKNKAYPLGEAIEIIKTHSFSKFTGTLESHINTTIPGIRGLVQLPFAKGKKLTILAFGPSTALGVNSTETGVILGDDSIIEEIGRGKINFDLIVATPDWMPKLAKVARVLGPKGLMPNPKNGTITQDVKKAIDSFQAGKTEYKTEGKAPLIHLALGKLDQPTEQLAANVKILLQTLGKTRVKKVNLSPTMGPSVKLDLSSV